jgi:hypothetical protein
MGEYSSTPSTRMVSGSVKSLEEGGVRNALDGSREAPVGEGDLVD